MAGGTLQLLFSKKKESNTKNDPKLTFFKAVVSKYHNFALEPINLSFDYSNIDEFKETTFSCVIPKYSPLITHLSLRIDVPLLHSSDADIQIKWKSPVALYLLKRAELLIGNQIIETLTGEWIHAYNNIFSSPEENEIFNSLCSESIIPLPFWFVRQKQYLPLKNLEYDSVTIRITLRPLRECFVIRKRI